MKTLFMFFFILAAIYLYIVYFYNIVAINFMDVMHTAFLRQFIFELIPFVILFGSRDIKFIDVSSTGDFFNSIIGRSMMGMIGFTFVSYVINSVSPKKINILNPITNFYPMEKFNSANLQKNYKQTNYKQANIDNYLNYSGKYSLIDYN